jgi:hypothetical protein
MFVIDFARWPEFRSRLAAFTELLSAGIRFLRTIARSRTALAAEVLFSCARSWPTARNARYGRGA